VTPVTDDVPEETEPEETEPEETEPEETEPEETEPEETEPEARRYPSTIGGAFYIGVLVVCAVAIGLVASGSWRLGIKVLAGALVAAGGLRLLLPARDAGMLAVRHRAIDVTLLAGLGGLLWFLAVSIPDQPG
jgi:hypothetical protein